MSQNDFQTMMQYGIAAAKKGDKVGARPFLQRATEIDPDNELGWLWLAGVAESPQKTVACLQRVLKLNPANKQARRGIEWFQARATRAATAAKAIAGKNDAKEQMTPETILVVDDSPTVRRLVAMTLEKHSYRVIPAADGMEAMSIINDERPDLILLDITMPRMDGYQLCKLIKGNRRTQHIPVIMLSGKDGFFDKVRGRMAGSTEYITKPFKSDMLVQVVKKYSNHHSN